MALLKVYKEISSLPATLQPDAIYLVRVGAGYDMYVTDTTGAIAYSSNGGGGAVDSVNGQTGAVTLTKSDIGLGNVDNTSDANKPVSTAQQTALDAKENSANKATTMTGNTASNVLFLTAKAVYDWAVGLFQPLLVSGTNIKTINGSSILGAGNLVISGGGSSASPQVVHSSVQNGTPVTGTTAITALRIVTIPANTLSASCIIDIFVRSLRTGTLGTSTLYLYANTSASLTGATLLANSASTTTRITQSIVRTLRLFNGNLTTMANAGYSDYNADQTESTFAFNVANANYIIFAIANTSASDSTRVVTTRILATNELN